MVDYTLLQWMLLFIGIVIVVAIYFYTKYQSKEKKDIARDISDKHIETTQFDDKGSIDALLNPNGLVSEENSDLPFGIDKTLDNPSDDQLQEGAVLALNVCAPTGAEWSGEKVMKCALASHLRCGDKNIFEYTVNDEDNQEMPLFYVANFVNPGIFDWDNMAQMKIKGLCLFVQIPSPLCSAKEALTKLLDCGQQLADKLGASLCDDKRDPLSKQSVKDMYALCREYDTRD